MYEFTLWLCQLTVYTSVTAAILLAVKHILKYRLPPVLHFALWGILLIRLVVPVLPQSPVSVFNFLPRNGQITEEVIFGEIFRGEKPAESGTYIEKLLAAESPQQHAASMGIDVSLYEEQLQQQKILRQQQLRFRERILWGVLLVYTAGVAGCLLHLSLCYVRMRRRSLWKTEICEDSRVLERYGQFVRHLRIREKNAPRLLYGERSMLSGILHPVIVLDRSTDPADVPMVLAHELNHFRQRDNLLLMLVHVFCCVLWFNPLVWIARSSLRDDLEILCDSRTLQLPSVVPGRYAQLLYSSADCSQQRKAAVSYMSAQGSFLKYRLRQIASRKRDSLCTKILSAVLCVSAMLMCLTDPVQSLSDGYSVYMKTGENLAGEVCHDEDPGDGISGVRFYNMIYSTLRNRTGGDASPLIGTLGDGSLGSFIRKTAAAGASFAGFGAFMMDAAAENNLTWEQAAIILDTIVQLSADRIYSYDTNAVPRQIREGTLEQVLQNLPEQQAKALLSCYNRGSGESDIRFASCYSVETIVRIMQCIENEWLRMKFISYYYTCPVSKLQEEGLYSEITAQTRYDYVYRLQTDTLEREEQTLREILAITNSGLREDVFYLKSREDLYSYADIAALYEAAGFDRRDMQEEYAALGYNELDSSSGSIGWSVVEESVSAKGEPTHSAARSAARKMCAYGIMDLPEEGEFPYEEPLTFGEAMHILCLLYAGMRS